MGIWIGSRTRPRGHVYPGTAVRFADITGATVCRRTSDLATGTAASLACWVKLEKTSAQTPITHFVGASGGYYITLNASNQAEFVLVNLVGNSSNTAPSAGTAVSTGSWHLLVGGLDGSTLYFSIDGGTYVTASQVGLCHTGNTTFSLGGFGDAGTSTILGAMDSCALWNKRLSQTEVGYLWNGGVGLAYWDVANNPSISSLQTSLLAWYDCEDQDQQLLTDATGNGKTLTGMDLHAYTSVPGIR